MKNRIIKLKPYYSEKIWGYEKWNLSTHKSGNSIVEETNEKLADYLNEELPILIKIIKSNESLSVQVHPSNEYARKYENDNGKTECWYILEAKEDAHLICNIKEGLTREILKKAIEDGRIEEHLKKIPVKPGDMVYIPSGTVHAIQGGIKLLEIQQSSDITYRLYDWGRDREVHIEKSLDVIDFEEKNNAGKIENFNILTTPYFNVEKICVNKRYTEYVDKKFYSFTVIKGSGEIACQDNIVKVEKEDTVYIPNGVRYTINGDLELIKAY